MCNCSQIGTQAWLSEQRPPTAVASPRRDPAGRTQLQLGHGPIRRRVDQVIDGKYIQKVSVLLVNGEEQLICIVVEEQDEIGSET